MTVPPADLRVAEIPEATLMNSKTAADLTNAQLGAFLDLRRDQHGARLANATKLRAFILASGSTSPPTPTA